MYDPREEEEGGDHPVCARPRTERGREREDTFVHLNCGLSDKVSPSLPKEREREIRGERKGKLQDVKGVVHVCVCVWIGRKEKGRARGPWAERIWCIVRWMTKRPRNRMMMG